jgi:hypothetical protein
MDGREECARDLVLAVFRLAVSDYLGLSYGHDGFDRARRIHSPFPADARLFLTSRWAGHLAEMAGLVAETVWREAQVLGESAASSRTGRDGWRRAA